MLFSPGVAEQFAIAEAKLRAWTSVDEEDGPEEEDTDSCDEDNSKNTDVSPMTETTGMIVHVPADWHPFTDFGSCLFQVPSCLICYVQSISLC